MLVIDFDYLNPASELMLSLHSIEKSQSQRNLSSGKGAKVCVDGMQG